MCSVLETEPLPRKKGKKKKNKVELGEKVEGSCMKCTEMAVILVRNGDPLCKTCCLDYNTHKFRATIGKARVVYQGEQILLAVSGGSASAAMLDLVVRGLSKETAKKLRFQPSIVYIDEGVLLGRSIDDRQAVREHIKTISLNAGFQFHVLNLPEIYPGVDLEISNRKVVDLFNNVSTITAKDDLLQHLYRQLLLKCACDHGYDKVMVGDSGTMLSVRILSDVAQGRGSQLPLNIGFQDTRSDISILRPMREFSKKEIEFYNNFQKVTSFSKLMFTTKASIHASINRLTQDFIFGLQAGFPSTVSTVLRTADKVTSDIQHCDSSCSLCGAPINMNTLDTSKVGVAGRHNGDTSCGGVCVGDDSNGCGTKTHHGGRASKFIDGVKSSGGCGTKTHHGGATKLIDGGNSGDGGYSGVCINDDSNGCATKIHHSVSGDKKIGDPRSGDIENCGTTVNSCCVPNNQTCCSQNKSSTQIPPEIIHSTLCYGCKLTHKDFRASEIALPAFVSNNAMEMYNRIAMKAEIEDYLIDEDSS